MAINHASKYSPKVAERLKRKSITAGMASTEYEFDGVKSVLVYSVDTAPIGKYTRSGSNRYGTPEDLTDRTQTLTMSEDDAFTYVIDKGDNEEQLNIKAANRSLQREIDERVIPMLDKDAIKKWVKGAGSVVTHASGTNINKNSAIEFVLDCTEALDEAAAPEGNRFMLVTNNGYKLVKENPQWVYTDKNAQNVLVKGQIGEIDGMAVVKVPNSYMPTGIDWLIVHKSAILAPTKLKEYKIHQDPPGINGSLVEGRILHDAFVLDAKAGAVCVMANAAVVTAAPTLASNADNATVTPTQTGGFPVFLTIDGSDPRNSGTRYTVNANTALNLGTEYVTGKTVRAIAYNQNGTVAYSAEAEGTLA